MYLIEKRNATVYTNASQWIAMYQSQKIVVRQNDPVVKV